MAALKAARDALNTTGAHGFALVATSSNRVKLAQLVSGREHAFYGAQLIDFAPLGDKFIAWLLAHVNLATKPSPPATMAAFERCGRRPELLLAALRSLVLTPGASSAQQVDERLQQEVDRAVDVLRQAFEEELDQLPALQRALLARVAHPRRALCCVCRSYAGSAQGGLGRLRGRCVRTGRGLERAGRTRRTGCQGPDLEAQARGVLAGRSPTCRLDRAAWGCLAGKPGGRRLKDFRGKKAQTWPALCQLWQAPASGAS